MLYDKKTKALFFEGKEKTQDILEPEQMNKLSRFLGIYFNKLRRFGSEITELKEQFSMHFGIKDPMHVFEIINDIPLKQLYLMIEIFAKVQLEIYKTNRHDLFILFVYDINNFFMIEKVPLQLIYVKKTADIFMEKVIDDVHSDKVKETLFQFDKYKKIHEDFKQAIVSYSSGDNKGAIEKSCIAIEDYLCVILDKKTCHSIDSDYKEAAKKLHIPDDVNGRFKSMISFIHKFRSKPVHGSKEKHDHENPRLIAQVVIGFTMVILNYLYNLFEKTS